MGGRADASRIKRSLKKSDSGRRREEPVVAVAAGFGKLTARNSI
jgi:hypothetical protein